MVNIMDLDFDCLWTVFDYLDLRSLCSVADTCDRFREQAQNVYQYSKFKNMFNIYSDLCHPQEYPDVILRRTSSVLRNFGPLIQAIHVNGGGYDLSPLELRIHQTRLINLISTHCRGTLFELTLHGFEVNDRVARFLRPVSRGVRKLKLTDCQIDGWSWSPLKRLAPKLSDLEISCSTMQKRRRLNGWHHCVPSMQTLALKGVNVLDTDVDGILGANPQLKCVKFVYCESQTDAVLHTIATHLPHVEKLNFRTSNETHPHNIACLQRMANLHSLKLSGIDGNFRGAVIALADLALEDLHLKLSWDDQHHNAQQLIAAVVKLHTLKSLRLDDCRNLTREHIISICDQLTGLEQLQLKYYHRYVAPNRLHFTGGDLVQMLRRAEHLKLIDFYGINFERMVHIDSNTFNRMEETIQRRSSKACVEIHFEEIQPIVFDVPEATIEGHSAMLKFEIKI